MGENHNYVAKVKWNMIVFKKTGKYYTSETIELPDKSVYELIGLIRNGEISLGYKTMTRVLYPDGSDRTLYPMMFGPEEEVVMDYD